MRKALMQFMVVADDVDPAYEGEPSGPGHLSDWRQVEPGEITVKVVYVHLMA
jgi:hypothetical protein